MEALNHAIMYFLSFKSYVVLPVIIFILAMIFRVNFQIAIKSALRIGIGFIGIFMVFDYFVKLITPVVQALIQRTGLHFNVLDVGWPPLAAIAWSFKLVPVLLVVFMVINIAMLVLKLTKAVDIDIWNYWHILLVSAMIYHLTANAFLTIILSSVIFILVLKLAEWSAPMVNKFSGMNGWFNLFYLESGRLKKIEISSFPSHFPDLIYFVQFNSTISTKVLLSETRHPLFD